MWSRPGGAPLSDFEPQFERGRERAILELARPGGGSARRCTLTLTLTLTASSRI
jgi:hypothetical protein